MRVIVDIPLHLVKHLEYIPEEFLQDIVIRSLESAIFLGSKRNLSKELNIESLLSLLNKGTVLQEVKPVEEIRVTDKENELSNFVYTADVVESGEGDDIDDDDDFMDLMK